MNKYKVEFIQTETFIIDVLAENQEKAEKKAGKEWDTGNYQETGDVNVEIGMVYDVSDTDDPFYS